METNKLITIKYQQFLLYSERKVKNYRKLIIQLDARDAAFLHIMEFPLSVIQEKILIVKSIKT